MQQIHINAFNGSSFTILCDNRGAISPWRFLVEVIENFYRIGSDTGICEPETPQICQVIVLMIQAGADLDVSLPGPGDARAVLRRYLAHLIDCDDEAMRQCACTTNTLVEQR